MLKSRCIQLPWTSTGVTSRHSSPSATPCLSSQSAVSSSCAAGWKAMTDVRTVIAMMA